MTYATVRVLETICGGPKDLGPLQGPLQTCGACYQHAPFTPPMQSTLIDEIELLKKDSGPFNVSTYFHMSKCEKTSFNLQVSYCHPSQILTSLPDCVSRCIQMK